MKIDYKEIGEMMTEFSKKSNKSSLQEALDAINDIVYFDTTTSSSDYIFTPRKDNTTTIDGSSIKTRSGRSITPNEFANFDIEKAKSGQRTKLKKLKRLIFSFARRNRAEDLDVIMSDYDKIVDLLKDLDKFGTSPIGPKLLNEINELYKKYR